MSLTELQAFCDSVAILATSTSLSDATIAQLRGIEDQLNSHLTRLDELSNLMASLHHTVNPGPTVLAQRAALAEEARKRLEALYERIDVYMAYVEKVERSLGRLETRMTTLEKNFGRPADRADKLWSGFKKFTESIQTYAVEKQTSAAPKIMEYVPLSVPAVELVEDQADFFEKARTAISERKTKEAEVM